MPKQNGCSIVRVLVPGDTVNPLPTTSGQSSPSPFLPLPLPHSRRPVPPHSLSRAFMLQT